MENNIATAKAVKTNGIEAITVSCETTVLPGIGIHLIGVADATVKEILLRTVTALQAYGYRIPGKKIIINIAPGELYKEGSGYDLAVALSMLKASGQERLTHLDDYIVLGELGLDGSLRAVQGAVHAAVAAKQDGMKGCIIPTLNAHEFDNLMEGDVPVYAADSLRDAIAIIHGEIESMTVWDYNARHREGPAPVKAIHWDDIPGHESEKRAMEIAAAGGHNLLLVGPVGSMKSALSKAVRDILPPLTAEQVKQNALIHSAGFRYYDNRTRPFREPHYSSSQAALFGGGPGNAVQPGEFSLAHNGVIHIDEINMCPKATQEKIKTVMEDGKTFIPRMKSVTVFPADIMLVGSMDTCPCGHYGDGDKCTCTENQRSLFLDKLTPGLYEQFTVCAYAHPEMPNQIHGEPSAVIAERVARARDIQRKRFEGLGYETNDKMPFKDVERFCLVTDEVKELIEKITSHLNLSVRAYTRILKIARTIADLEGSESILPQHVAEASSYRFLDRREFWRKTA